MFGEFTKSTQRDISQVVTGKMFLTTPVFGPDMIISLCQGLRDLFTRKPMVVSINNTFIIVGICTARSSIDIASSKFMAASTRLVVSENEMGRFYAGIMAEDARPKR
jgi:hypothetical protein